MSGKIKLQVHSRLIFLRRIMEEPVEVCQSFAETLLYYHMQDMNEIIRQHSKLRELKSTSSLLDFLSSSSYLLPLPSPFWTFVFLKQPSVTVVGEWPNLNCYI